LASTTRFFPTYCVDVLSSPPTRSEKQLARLLECEGVPERARAALRPFSVRRIEATTKKQIARWSERRKKRRCSEETAAAEIAALIERARHRHEMLARRLAVEWSRAVFYFEDLIADEAHKALCAEEDTARAKATGQIDHEPREKYTSLDLAIAATTAAGLENDGAYRRLRRERSELKILKRDIVEKGRAEGLLSENQRGRRNRRPGYRPGVKRPPGEEPIKRKVWKPSRDSLRDLLREDNPERPIWTDDRPKRWSSR
jgi:hypothetical protein